MAAQFKLSLQISHWHGAPLERHVTLFNTFLKVESPLLLAQKLFVEVSQILADEGNLNPQSPNNYFQRSDNTSYYNPCNKA